MVELVVPLTRPVDDGAALDEDEDRLELDDLVDDDDLDEEDEELGLGSGVHSGSDHTEDGVQGFSSAGGVQGFSSTHFKVVVGGGGGGGGVH